MWERFKRFNLSLLLYHFYVVPIFPLAVFAAIFTTIVNSFLKLLATIKFYLTGVPISAQWAQKGYYYPIQIAQYGLSHYSKYLSDRSRTLSGNAFIDWSSVV